MSSPRAIPTRSPRSRVFFFGGESRRPARYRTTWRAWPEHAFEATHGGREAGAAGIVREFAEPFARHGFPRAFRGAWARGSAATGADAD